MKKPSWEDAPEWAKYLAMDKCGIWCWYQHKPRTATRIEGEWDLKIGLWVEDTSALDTEDNSWKESLEKRPES